MLLTHVMTGFNRWEMKQEVVRLVAYGVEMSQCVQVCTLGCLALCTAPCKSFTYYTCLFEVDSLYV